MITIEQIYDEIIKVMERYPDNVYDAKESGLERCSYTKGKNSDIPDCEGCLLGIAFKNLGVSIPDFLDNDLIVCVINYLRSYLGIISNEDPKLENRIRSIQLAQDRHIKWGDIIEYLDYWGEL